MEIRCVHGMVWHAPVPRLKFHTATAVCTSRYLGPILTMCDDGFPQGGLKITRPYVARYPVRDYGY